MVTIDTERLTLHALNMKQLELGLNNPELLGKELGVQVTSDVFSEESRTAMSIKMARMAHAEDTQHVWYTYFLLVLNAQQKAIGVCGFKGAPSPFGSVEVGYAIHEDYRNHGYMTEAVKALVQWAFTHQECRRVTAETLRNNHASQRVLQKAGLDLDRASENMLFWKVDRGL